MFTKVISIMMMNAVSAVLFGGMKQMETEIYKKQ